MKNLEGIPTLSQRVEGDTPESAASDIEAAERSVRKAKLVISEIDSTIREERQQAGREIDARHKGELDAAYAARREAEAALNALKDRAPGHAWDGKRVFQIRRAGRYSMGAQERIEAMIETVRPSSKFADNLSRYVRPEIGDVIARFLKKDGTPGLKFERLGRHHTWALADDAPLSSAVGNERSEVSGLPAK